MDEILGKIADFGDEAHGEQMRKYVPDRYMVHPKRVMEKLKHYTNDKTVLAAALLHDVLEDTPVSEEQMLRFLKSLMNEEDAKRTTKLVVELSDVYVKEDYPKLNRRTRKAKELDRLITTSGDSQTIKYADILDNTLEIVDQDTSFALVYLREVRQILRKLDKGNTKLHEEAVNAVEAGLQKLGAK